MRISLIFVDDLSILLIQLLFTISSPLCCDLNKSYIIFQSFLCCSSIADSDNIKSVNKLRQVSISSNHHLITRQQWQRLVELLEGQVENQNKRKQTYILERQQQSLWGRSQHQDWWRAAGGWVRLTRGHQRQSSGSVQSCCCWQVHCSTSHWEGAEGGASGSWGEVQGTKIQGHLTWKTETHLIVDCEYFIVGFHQVWLWHECYQHQREQVWQWQCSVLSGDGSQEDGLSWSLHGQTEWPQHEQKINTFLSQSSLLFNVILT